MNADGTGLRELAQTPGDRRGGRLAAVVTRWPSAGRTASARDRRAVFVIDAEVETAAADSVVASRRRARLVSRRKPDRVHVQRGRAFERLGQPLHGSAGRNGLTQLTHASGGHVQYLSASFSPDGKWLTVSRTPGSGKKETPTST